jgi:hypothetical protein
MKKLVISGLLSASLISGMAFAGGTAAPVEEPPAPSGLEISGNVDVLVGYQRDSANAANASASAATACGAGGLTQGDLGACAAGGLVPTASADHFRFLVDQVEIDLSKEFGENLRVRADIDASDLVGTARRVGDVFEVEQAYVTWNIGSGDGAEWLVGKFNLPIGLESVDRNDNVFSTYTPGFQFVLPTNVIGTKIYWAFTDNWSLDVGAVNNLNGLINGNSAIPTGFFRIGANWGDEGNESYVNLGGAFGPEQNVAVTGQSENTHYDMLGALWGQVALSDTWDIGFEGLYRRTNAITAGGVNQQALAGQLFFVWEATDLWDFQLRYAMLWDLDPVSAAGDGIGASTTSSTFGGFEGMTHSGTLGATYAIADEAKVKIEYRFDFASNDAAGLANATFHTGVAEFAYSF